MKIVELLEQAEKRRKIKISEKFNDFIRDYSKKAEIITVYLSDYQKYNRYSCNVISSKDGLIYTVYVNEGYATISLYGNKKRISSIKCKSFFSKYDYVINLHGSDEIRIKHMKYKHHILPTPHNIVDTIKNDIRIFNEYISFDEQYKLKINSMTGNGEIIYKNMLVANIKYINNEFVLARLDSSIEILLLLSLAMVNYVGYTDIDSD